MGTKKGYSRTRPPEEGKRGAKSMFVRGLPHGLSPGRGGEKCTCWVLMRGDGPENLDPQTADCELVPDPACPVHSKKYFPILDE